jgi:arylsulfatase
MIAHIDKRFGDLEKFLAESGLADNTLVIFMTDNGGTAGVKLFNAGLRGHKTEYYEGGHRVPCWIRWPQGKLGAPRDIEVPTQVQDILPTLLELCDVPSQDAKFDGVSLAGLLRGTQNAIPERAFVVQYSRDKVTKGDACVVRGKWRLVKDAELYDVSTDLEQKNDLAAQHPEIVRELRGHYETWWQQIGEQVDVYEPCATIGSPKHPEITLTSADWEGIYADNTGHIRRAVGGPRGGHWHVQVEAAGKYEFTLRRWPRETGTALGEGHNDTPEIARYAGQNYNPLAKKFPIAAGVVRIAGRQAQAKTSPSDQEVVVTLELPAGKTTFSAWFQDAAGEDLCGAFFVRIVRNHK